MSDYQFTQLHRAREADLRRGARDAALARSLPRRPGLLARLRGLVRPSTRETPHPRPGTMSA